MRKANLLIKIDFASSPGAYIRPLPNSYGGTLRKNSHVFLHKIPSSIFPGVVSNIFRREASERPSSWRICLFRSVSILPRWQKLPFAIICIFKMQWIFLSKSNEQKLLWLDLLFVTKVLVYIKKWNPENNKLKALPIFTSTTKLLISWNILVTRVYENGTISEIYGR